MYEYFGVYFLTVAVLFERRSQSLDCFVCHSRQNSDCGDPFLHNGNSSGALKLHECDRVKKVGESVVAASSAMGGMPPPYTPLEGPSYVCYKITMGQHAVRGCAKPDFCTNMTEVCEVCNTDGCNAATAAHQPDHLILVPSMALLTSLQRTVFSKLFK
ncbi:hypothetical protein GE061_011814 [Apolygus lucorum]|uniref:Protein sleepless n=1 Tax=Apolygus lucorum TaxID=248454 RepID=A0A6A4K4F5_APOLU|nr:hypothetical protein GE061_011814 [Apolygus lucorum]